MIRREEGFTLVELLITMVVFVLVIAAASSIFSSLLNQFKQQSRIMESNTEGVVGLEMLRSDLQQAGFGLPWHAETGGPEDADDNWQALDRYLEAAGASNSDPTDPSYYNDGDTPSAFPGPPINRAPRAILAQNDAGPELGNGLHSDYLVVKSTSIGLGAPAQKWTYITNDDDVISVRIWNPTNDPAAAKNAYEDLENNDLVVLERAAMGTGGLNQRVLLTNGGAFFTTFMDTAAAFPAAFKPLLSGDTNIIYGVATTALRAPFNRADFYVAAPVDNMPSKCAPNTGILYKAVMNQGTGAGGGDFTRYPLLDCVADMQVVFLTFEDLNNNGTMEAKELQLENADYPYTTFGATGQGLIAQEIRDRVKGVVVYVLAHEGQRDTNFTFNNFSTGCGVGNCIRVGDFDNLGNLMGREFDLSRIGAGFANYRWKVYKIAAELPNL